MAVSILTAPGVRYPPDDEAFSPSVAHPEYRLGPVAVVPNPVYDQVRNLFAQLGLDKDRLGSPDWNPLRTWIPEGARVFVLCNFVYHRRPQESPEGFAAKCIHGSVLRALVDYVLLATGQTGEIAFGNSPLQSTNWRRVLRESGAARVEEFYRERSLPVRAADLRLYVAERNLLGRTTSIEPRDGEDGVEIVLEDDSLLGEIPGRNAQGNTFRISDYDPRRIQSFHDGSRHRYVIHREILDADVVISLSKLKTHEKVGITCGLKGFVGAVGHKDCLAHHRFGSPRTGGDEYPSSLSFLQPVSRLHDWVNRRGAGAPLQGAAQIADRSLRRILRRLGLVTSGAWHGNDTCWRMTLDLARILHHADRNGALCARNQRTHLSLIDGIIAGEGNGPLTPRAAYVGTLLFGDDVPATDRVACRVMGFDPDAIPLVRRAFSPMAWPITELSEDAPIECVENGVLRADREVEPVLGRPFAPPSGWRGHLG